MAEVEEPERVSLRPREVEFDWSTLPMHWVPNDPFTTHLFNVLHLLLPEGERWFVRLFSEALPMVRDEKVAEDVRGFIGQEAMHAESHQSVLDHLDSHGLHTERYVGQVRWLFRKALGERDFGGPDCEREQADWVVERVAAVAAIEHFTAVMGHIILNSPGLDEAGADPTMLDLLRWHGAEEVEHRAVAYDLYQHLDGRYWPRVKQMLVVAPGMAMLWARGVSYLMANDPTGRRKARLRDLRRPTAYGLPNLLTIAMSVVHYLRRGYHPAQYGSTSQAVAYLATSPAAAAADRRAGR